jgi:ATP/ADP translocase
VAGNALNPTMAAAHTCAVAVSLPSLRTSLLIARGGATVAASTVLTSKLENAFAVSGGGGKSKEQPSRDVKILGISVTPEGRSVLFMAIAMSLHYLGYSFARPSTLALFTSTSTGYSSPAAFALAMAFVSPTALLLLIAYSRVLDKYEPRGALTRTSLFCAGTLSLAAAAIVLFQQSGLTFMSIPAAKFITGPLFVFRESYVQLLTSQYWSFMASVLTPTQSSMWFAPISGLTSFTSALAGLSVSTVVEKLGLPGALIGTSIMLLLSLFATEKAYSIAERYGFNPAEEVHKKQKAKRGRGNADTAKESDPGLIQKAADLFARVPTLKALFLEILSAQGLATLLNICFVAKLTSSIPDDAERAGWMGKFFALINIISMTIQFGVLPPLMTFLEPRHLWRTMPIIMMCFTTFQSLQRDPSLYVVSASLLVMKTLEYSVRRMLDEMVYVPLDFESRYVGKEVIGVFGYRFGKSSMSLFLSALTAVFGSFGLHELSLLTSGASLLWLSSAWRLSNFVLTRKEAEEVYQQKKIVSR